MWSYSGFYGSTVTSHNHLMTVNQSSSGASWLAVCFLTIRCDQMLHSGPLKSVGNYSYILVRAMRLFAVLVTLTPVYCRQTQPRRQIQGKSLPLVSSQAARQKIQTLEASVENFLSRESKMKHMIRTLEQERAAHQKTIERMRSSLPPDAPTDVEMTQIKTGPNGKAKTAAKKP